MIKVFILKFDQSWKYLIIGISLHLIIPVWNMYLYGIDYDNHKFYLYLFPFLFYLIFILKMIISQPTNQKKVV